MAIDTRDKRSSAIFPLMPFRALLPAPDGTVDQGDRQTVVFLYSGILAEAAAAIVGKLCVSFSATQPSMTFEVKECD